MDLSQQIQELEKNWDNENCKKLYRDLTDFSIIPNVELKKLKLVFNRNQFINSYGLEQIQRKYSTEVFNKVYPV